LLGEFPLPHQLEDARAEGSVEIHRWNIVFSDDNSVTQTLAKLLLLTCGILLVEMNFLSVLLRRDRCTTAHHVRCLSAWLKTRDTKCDLTRLFHPDLALRGRHLVDLSDDTRPSLQARTPIQVKLKSSLNMPLNALTEPRLAQPVDHLKADDFMVGPHEVLKYGDLLLLKSTIKYMSLHHIFSVLPHFRLPFLLEMHDIACDVLAFLRLLKLYVVVVSIHALIDGFDPVTLLLAIFHVDRSLK
jgi:hypothetical protein